MNVILKFHDSIIRIIVEFSDIWGVGGERIGYIKDILIYTYPRLTTGITRSTSARCWIGVNLSLSVRHN